VKRSNGVVETVETVETVKNAAAALSTLKRKNYRLNFSVANRLIMLKYLNDTYTRN